MIIEREEVNTVGELLEFLKTANYNTPISIQTLGNSDVNDVSIERTIYDNGDSRVNLVIDARECEFDYT